MVARQVPLTHFHQTAPCGGVFAPHMAPPSKEYSTTAVPLTFVRVKAGLLVTLSVLELPVSVVRPVIPGMTGATVS